MLYRIPFAFIGLAAAAGISWCQVSPVNKLQPGTLKTSDDSTSLQPESKRIFGIIPNYRTSPTLNNFEPLITREKFKIATQDSFDRGTFALAAIFGGLGQLTNSNRSFGQGAAGFGRYYGTSLADFVIGDYMTEAIYPSLLHQDPRYFRQGTGSGWSRLRYAAGQIIWTHTDAAEKQFNYSEILGNSTTVAISNAYYPDTRNASDNAQKLLIAVGTDTFSNVAKEFWPDVKMWLKRKHSHPAETTTGLSVR